jgi:membrane-associated phospholipid phosphatase
MTKPNPTTGMPNTPAQNARLFALVNVGMADAGILVWDQKYVHDFWRPVVGIREHDTSMGATGEGMNSLDGECQLDWLPLGAPSTNSTAKNFTPPFPAYPSGHATFGAAANVAPGGEPTRTPGPPAGIGGGGRLGGTVGS